MKTRYALFFLISTAVFLLDQLAKFFIRSHLSLSEAIPVLSFFRIVYIDNTGSAFGLFKSLGNPFFMAISAAAIVVITVMIIKVRDNRLALSLILGGAAGNLIDRIVHGYVIDFLDFHAGRLHWPAFNIADSALTVGIALLLVDTVFRKSGKDRSRT
jgi:signal peptidase II